MTITDGEFVEDTTDAILAAMIADAKEYWGRDLSDGQESFVRAMYTPVAKRFAEAQTDVGLVLQSSQLENAEGAALDYLTALIGVVRTPAGISSGSAEFGRETASTDTDYTVPAGTIVQTSGSSPIKFTTTESGTLAAGTTAVTIPIEATEGGIEGNVGANTLTVMPSAPSGIETVTNLAATIGGREQETDTELRVRAKEQLSAGSRASANALLSAVQRVTGVRSSSIFINDTNDLDADGQDPHSFELVVSGGSDQEIAQTIFDTKAAGDTVVAGVHGTNSGAFTVDLINGQQESLPVSRPVEKQVYVDLDLTITDSYAGDTTVEDTVVQYIGGILSTGSTASGELGVGDNVILSQIESDVQAVFGVHDITLAEIGFTSSPTGTTNLTIADGETAIADATDASIIVTTTQL